MIDQNKQLVVLISHSLKPPKKKKTEQKSGNKASKGGVFLLMRGRLHAPSCSDPTLTTLPAAFQHRSQDNQEFTITVKSVTAGV